MMAHFGRPREKFSNGTLPKPKPYTKEMFKKQSDLYLQGYFGAEDKELYKNNLENVFKKGVEEGVVSEEEALEWIQDRKKIYSTLIEEAGKQPAEFPPAYSVEPDINKYYENQLATGGRVGLEGGSDILTVDAHGSKTGAQQIENAPKGWTSDKETFDIIAGLKIPVSKKIKLLADLQYGKYRDQIEYKDQDVHLEDPKSYRERKFGISYNEGGEGLSGHAKVNVDTGDPEAYIQFTKKFEDGGRVGFNEGTKPVLPRNKFVELRIKYKTTHNNAEFAELLNKDWRPSQADSFNKDSVTKRIKDAKHLFPDNFDYKGSHEARAVTEKRMIELWGNEKYQEHKKNFSDEALRKKYSTDLDYKKKPIEEKQAKSKRTVELKKKKLAAMDPDAREEFIAKEKEEAAARTRKKRGQTIKFYKNSRDFKSILWGDLVSRTYRNLLDAPFKFSEESLKLMNSKPELNRLDMEKITLIDKNNKPFTWDTIESYVKEGNALNSKGKPMSWDEITKAHKIKEFINKEGLAQKINKSLIPNYDPKTHIKQSGLHIAHNTSFKDGPWETHIAPYKANIQEGAARKIFTNLWTGADTEFEASDKGEKAKERRMNLRRKAVTNYYTTMEPITEIKYGLGKKQHGAATPIEKLFEKAGIKLNAEDTTKLSRTIQSIMNKQNSGLNVVDIAKWGSAELTALDDIAGKIPSKALGAFGKILKVAGVAAIPMDFIPIAEARSKGLGANVGLMNLAEIYTNLPGVIWEAGEWVGSKLKGKKHEWKPPYETTFGQEYETQKLRDTSVKVLEENISNLPLSGGYLEKKLGTAPEELKLIDDQTKEALINQMRKEKALADKKEVVTENKPTYGFYADQIKNLKIP
jgi:hypothetical protein